MKLSEKIAHKHTQSDKLYKKRDDYAINNFIVRTNLSRELQSEIEKKTKNNKLKVQSRENLIINIITALEVFIKDSIKGKFVHFSAERQQELLKEKITLWDAYKLFRHTKIRTEDIIAGYYNFQNLDSIHNVLSTLSGKDFFKNINEAKIDLTPDLKAYFELSELNLKSNFPDWQQKVREVMEIRHESVHEIDFTRRLGKKRTHELIKCLIAFTFSVNHFFGETFDDFMAAWKNSLDEQRNNNN